MMLLEVDPNLVRPGWTPLVVIVLLGVVLFFLGRSMIKQFGRIDVPVGGEVDQTSSEAPTDPEAAEAARADRAADADPSGAVTPRDPGAGTASEQRIPDLRSRTPEGGRAAPPDQR